MNIEFRPVRVSLFRLADEQAAIQQAKAEPELPAKPPSPQPTFTLRGVRYEFCPGADRWIMAPGELAKSKDFTGLKYAYTPIGFQNAIWDELEDGIYGSANPGHVAAEEDRDTIMWPSEKFDAYCRDVAQAVAEDRHASDCATHNEPAMPKGECDCGAFLNREDFDAYKDDVMNTRLDTLAWSTQSDPTSWTADETAGSTEDDGFRCTFHCGDVVTFKSGGAWMTIEDLDYHGEGVFTADLIWTEETGRLWELDGIDVRLLSLVGHRNAFA